MIRYKLHGEKVKTVCVIFVYINQVKLFYSRTPSMVSRYQFWSISFTCLQEGIHVTSLPMGRPHPSDVHSPTTLAMSVRRVRYSFNTTPRKIVFISGIPEPATQTNQTAIVSYVICYEPTITNLNNLVNILFMIYCSIINLLWSLMLKMSTTFRSVSYGPCLRTDVTPVHEQGL